MKIIYCIPSVFNSGGMERILSIKANYLADVLGYEVIIATTDQQGKEKFFNFSERIRFVDLGINYSDRNLSLNPISIIDRIGKLRYHKKQLGRLLKEEKPDIVMSMYQHEAAFLPTMNDGSIKLIESHFCRYYRSLAVGNPLRKLLSKIRLKRDNKTVKRYTRFITLTHEDKKDWPPFDNIEVIPNPITIKDGSQTTGLNNKSVLAVGRVTYQKGFDNLVKAWEIVEKAHPDWTLNIVGAQDDREYFSYIQKLIKEKGLKNINLKQPTKNIEQEYLQNDFLVMTSVYEGLPLVLIEGMSKGLPLVSFSCKCGPSDIIKDGENGFLVNPGDYKTFAERINFLIENPGGLQKMSEVSKRDAEEFRLEKIMERWDSLFTKLTKKNA